MGCHHQVRDTYLHTGDVGVHDVHRGDCGRHLVGAAGAFILVPIMLVMLKILTRMTIATSLAITFISSIGSTVEKIVTEQTGERRSPE